MLWPHLLCHLHYLYSYMWQCPGLKYNVRNYSSASNNDLLKDYWSNIKPVSKWYCLDELGRSIEYSNKFKEINGIYIFRLIKEPWKCYVGSAESLSKRLLTHKWAFIHSINTGNSSVPLFYNAIKKHGWESFEIAVLEIVPIVELANRENYYLSSKPYYILIYSIDSICLFQIYYLSHSLFCFFYLYFLNFSVSPLERISL